VDQSKNLLVFINELRKHLRALGIAIILGSVAFYFVTPKLLDIIQKHLDQKLAFFTVAGPFLAHAKLAFIVSIVALMPWILYCLWKALSKPFAINRKTMLWFVFFTCCLFYVGGIFCYLVTLPLGVKFLLSFQSEQLKPVISIGKFISFVTIFVFAFGVIFELPVFMVFSAKVGICPRKTFEKNRRYAILAISIVAALLTPTPDVVNMLLMGGPLYLLYETGIITLKLLKIP
jgi:sec-independent protein translocase protein TatC